MGCAQLQTKLFLFWTSWMVYLLYRDALRFTNRKIPEKYRKIWDWADSVISEKELFPETPEVADVLDALSDAPIIYVDFFGGNTGGNTYDNGASWKWLATLEGEQKVMIKLLWEEKGSMKPRAKCSWGYEMPSSEIAAFHLHRVLGFGKTPFVVGRRINLWEEILPVASASVADQIKVVSSSETCVLGECSEGRICRTLKRKCPPDGIIEASVSYWVPRSMHQWSNNNTQPLPIAARNMDFWDDLSINDRTHCSMLRNDPPYSEYFLDMLDLSVVDFLMYHTDRKFYTISDNSKANRSSVWIDHGRAFCAHDQDEEKLLSPIVKCCKLRKSTWEKIKSFKYGELSRKWHQSMTSDPIAPVMQDDWFPAIERRLATIIRVVGQCFDVNNSEGDVLQN